jgi:hypothetical protein
MTCPRCRGTIELRYTRRWDTILVCLGRCGEHWSLFDFKLAGGTIRI